MKKFLLILIGSFCLSSNLIAQQPIITSFTPQSGNAGTTITVYGYYLSNYSNNPLTTVRVNGVQVSNVSCSWNPSYDGSGQVTFPAPFGTDGIITITSPYGTISTSTNFHYNPPTITSFSPQYSPNNVSSVVTINGTELLNVNGTAPIVTFNGVPATIWGTPTTTQVMANIPLSTTGPISVSNSYGSATSSTNFVYNVPVISSFSVPSGYPGDRMTINGNYLQGYTIRSVSFGNAATLTQFPDIWSMSNSAVEVTIPSIPYGQYTITVATEGGTTQSSSPFLVGPYTISATPSSAAICSGSSIGLSASGPSSYTWSPSTGLSATTGANVTASPLSTTTYTVTGTTGNYSATKSVTVAVDPQAPSWASISSSNGNNICVPASTILTASPDGYSYLWTSNAHGTIGDTRSVTVYDEDTYTVAVSNLCGSAYASIYIYKSGPECNSVRIAAPGSKPDLTAPIQTAAEPNVQTLTAYPNPANSEVTVAVPSVTKNDRQIWIYDMFGTIQGTAILKKGEWKTTISTKEMSAGLYIINLSYGDWINTTKMMVVHK